MITLSHSNGSPKNWAQVDIRVRKRIVNLLRGEVIGARDQAERFRDPSSKHMDEAIALQWDEQAERIDNNYKPWGCGATGCECEDFKS